MIGYYWTVSQSVIVGRVEKCCLRRGSGIGKERCSVIVRRSDDDAERRMGFKGAEKGGRVGW